MGDQRGLPRFLRVGHRMPSMLPEERHEAAGLSPQAVDKCLAELAGRGSYHYYCPLDRAFFDFTGIDARL